RDGVAGGAAGGWTAVQRRAAEVVIADDRLRTENEPRLGESPDRDHVTVLIADIDAVDVIHAGSLGSLALQVDLPGATEQIEVIDVGVTEHRLQSVEHIRQVDAECLDLFAVDIEIDL